MIRLLISIRDVKETEAALAGGAEVIDLKEPARGSLGAPEPGMARRVAAAVAGRAPVSIACGELRDGPAAAHDWPPLPHEFGYAKVGLAGMQRVADWPLRWQRFRDALPPTTQAVAVAYADSDRAASPPPAVVLEEACRRGFSAFLLDTCVKDGRRLLDFVSLSELNSLICRARRRGLVVAVAGSLDRQLMPAIAALGPDIVAVRGAACREGRGGTVSRRRVARLKQLVADSAARAAGLPPL